ncbi:MAG: pyridoxamine 5'-phosphate oxidase family protein [Raineya sp.]|nr:pyridoxamine 5'-phosphate oxidase family protein [Raineya sp.]
MLNDEVKTYIRKSVLCWLATTDIDSFPNVSPKEVFTYSEKDTLLIAHIASPQTIKNIKSNNKVCVSFIDILVQKGYKIKGLAQVYEKSHPLFLEKAKPLLEIATERFPILAVIEVEILKVEKIIAPSYWLYPETTTEAGQIESAKKSYQID